jgi:hypothetical protein
VRFYPLDAHENLAPCYGGEYTMWLRDGRDPVDPLSLIAIPPLVLSEVLRDVDLFVGVASVGNDPTWQDGDPEGRLREYWTSYGFGELVHAGGTVPARPGRAAHLQDPPGVRQHPEVAPRPVPVHRAEIGHRRHGREPNRADWLSPL